MQISNTIYTVAVMHIDMCHMHTGISIYDINTLILITVSDLFIQHTDHRHKLWNDLLQISDRPFLQCFCKDRMICVSTYIGYNLCCFIKGDTLFHQQTDQFRNHHRRMCVIDLNGSIVCKVMQIRAFLLCLCKDQLCTICNHEILLIDTK